MDRVTGGEPGFPLDDYTPCGYLDNPGHAWRLRRSGVVRGSGHIGFAWHVPSYPGPYGRRWIYQAGLAIEIGGEPLHVEYHTSQLFRFRAGGAAVEMFLDREALVAWITAPAGTPARALAHYRRQLGASGDWDFGLLARQDADGRGHLATYAEGPAFALAGSVPPTDADTSPGDADWPDRSAPIEKRVAHDYRVPDSGVLVVALARAESSQAATVAVDEAVANAAAARLERLDRDARFWHGAPRLAGDWPAHWRRGLVYDFETLRAIVRPPAGVYRTRWDGMQIQVPRVVLAETALDMLLLSYADPPTAREVVLGTFADAIAPNVPCTREDGSVNMVAVDGSACGTAPAWCWPFWCIGLIHQRSGDRAWLAELVPHLEAFLEWWLANRVHPDGAPFYLCGWESGQDASPRFGAAERGGGGIERVRPVDLVAGLAQSARLLAGWLRELGRPAERWQRVADEYAAMAVAMWHRGWFHDWIGGTPTAPRDPMQLAPLLCGVATSAQRSALRGHFAALPDHGEYSSLEWPPVALTTFESALAAGEAEWAAAAAANLIDRVWLANDAREHVPPAPLPGVAHEHWPPGGDWGTEGYGWGATTTLLFMRYVAGIIDDPATSDLRIEPRLPPALMHAGRRYEIRNLSWRGERLDLVYTVSTDARSVLVEKRTSRR